MCFTLPGYLWVYNFSFLAGWILRFLHLLLPRLCLYTAYFFCTLLNACLPGRSLIPTFSYFLSSVYFCMYFNHVCSLFLSPPLHQHFSRKSCSHVLPLLVSTSLFLMCLLNACLPRGNHVTTSYFLPSVYFYFDHASCNPPCLVSLMKSSSHLLLLQILILLPIRFHLSTSCSSSLVDQLFEWYTLNLDYQFHKRFTFWVVQVASIHKNNKLIPRPKFRFALSFSLCRLFAKKGVP